MHKRSESKSNQIKGELNRKELDRREISALSPNGAVMADNSGRCEMGPLDLAHQVVINVRLPRHLLLLLLPLLLPTKV